MTLQGDCIPIQDDSHICPQCYQIESTIQKRKTFKNNVSK